QAARLRRCGLAVRFTLRELLTGSPLARRPGVIRPGVLFLKNTFSRGTAHMLDANLKTQLKAYLEKVTQPFEIVASLDDGAKSQEMLGLLQDIASLSDKIT